MHGPLAPGGGETKVILEPRSRTSNACARRTSLCGWGLRGLGSPSAGRGLRGKQWPFLPIIMKSKQVDAGSPSDMATCTRVRDPGPPRPAQGPVSLGALGAGRGGHRSHLYGFAFVPEVFSPKFLLYGASPRQRGRGRPGWTCS